MRCGRGEWGKDRELETQLDYWKQQLDSAPPNLQLPLDRPRPPVQTYRGGSQSLEIPEEVTRALKALSRRESATLFMTLLAAFDTLLYRLTGQDDVLVGTPIAGRNRHEIEELIGFFLNTLVLRTNLSDQPTFLELLLRVRETALDAYGHQDIPFEKLLAEFQPERDLSRTPFFQVFFNMISAGDASLSLQGLHVSRFPLGSNHANFDLTAYVSDQGRSIQVRFVYNADMFSQTRMAEMLAQYQHLLVQIAADPEQRLCQYSLITPATGEVLPNPRKPLSGQWQGSIQSHLTKHARMEPDQLAVIDTHESWTYRQLDLWSNRLANWLRASGIQSEGTVAIYGHRSAALVWAILGVLKAGAAFLVLDPAYPSSRLVEYLRTAEPQGWLQIQAAGDVPEPVRKALSTFDLHCQLSLPRRAEAQSRNLLGSHSSDDPALSIGPNDLAYIAFTSGSTGTPKGILGRHGPLTHFMPWQKEAFGLSAEDRFSMLSGLSHDPLQRDIFTALWVGATICIPDDDTIGTPGQLAEWMADEQVTFAHLTPAMSQILTEAAAPDSRLPSLRFAFFIGDRLTEPDIGRLTTLAPNITCVNSYGSTETQRAVGYYRVPPKSEDGWARVAYPLGSGLPDVQLLVLTRRQTMAGVGELGEIYVRSPHLARGYLDDEALTRERFLTNPFTNLADDRLYRTGDLGRYLPDGQVEFVGRSDQQIKSRGFRVELGEIESFLLQHHGIKEAVVLAREDEPGQRRLVAYVVPAQEPAPTSTSIRSLLRAKLPDYMVPAVIVSLDTLPLTPNRKLDRGALPAPDGTRSESGSAFSAPRTPEEKALADIWSDTLGVERISIHDNFFNLGGHSLLGVRLLGQINHTLNTKLPLATLFQAPTIEQLAAIIHCHRYSEAADWSPLISMRPTGSKPPLFVVPGNVGNVFTDLGDLAQYLDSDLPFYGLQDGPENPVRIEAMAARYLEEIREVQTEGPYLLVGVCSGAVVAFEMAQQLWEQGQEVALLAMVEPSYPQEPGLRTDIRFLSSIIRRSGPRLGHHARTLARFPYTGQGEYARLKLKVVANRWALRRYAPRPYPGSVEIFLTEASLSRADNRQAAWLDFAEGGARVHEIPGSHATIVGLDDTPIEPAHMQALAQQLGTCIQESLLAR